MKLNTLLTTLNAAAQAQQNDRTVRSAAKERPPPWSFGFQCNERYLEWDASAQRQLLKMHVAGKLDKVQLSHNVLQQLLLPNVLCRSMQFKACSNVFDRTNNSSTGRRLGGKQAAGAC